MFNLGLYHLGFLLFIFKKLMIGMRKSSLEFITYCHAVGFALETEEDCSLKRLNLLGV